MDYGNDFYAAVTWNNDPCDRPILIGWMNNWPYANIIPLTGWRGMLSMPRDLALEERDGTFLVVQRPLDSAAAYWAAPTHLGRLRIEDGVLPLPALSGPAVRLQLAFQLEKDRPAGRFGVHLRQVNGHQMTVAYDPAVQKLVIDRSRSGHVLPEMADLPVAWGKLAPKHGVVEVDIWVDQYSVELFADNGRLVMSSLIFPYDQSLNYAVFAAGGAVILESATLSHWQ